MSNVTCPMSNLSPFFFLRIALGVALLLAEKFLPIAQLDGARIDHVGAVLGERAAYRDLVANLKRLAGPAASQENGRCGEFNLPTGHLSRRVLHFQEEAGMGIDPIDPDHRARQIRLLGPIVLSSERMMGDKGRSGES